MRISDCSSAVCSSDLAGAALVAGKQVYGLAALDVVPLRTSDAVAVAAAQDHAVGQFQPEVEARQPVFVLAAQGGEVVGPELHRELVVAGPDQPGRDRNQGAGGHFGFLVRSEEHKSELQSLMRNSSAVFCLKKKNTQLYRTQ